MFMLTAFSLVQLTTIALPYLRIGPLPVRVLPAILLLSWLMLAYPGKVITTFRQNSWMVVLTLGLGLLGSVVSLFNQADPVEVFSQVVQIHLQGLVILITAATVAEVCGAGPAFGAFFFAVGVTVAVAIAQFFEFAPAWELRGAIGRLQAEVFGQFGFFAQHRSMGISSSPITLATQVCLAFAGYCVLQRRRLEGRFDRRLLRKVTVATMVFIVICVLSGNRSPILGAVVFLAMLYARRKLWTFLGVSVVLVPFLILVGPSILDSLSDSGLRAANVGDKSSAGRLTLSYYGYLLVTANPLGYGLTFDPTETWGPFWSALQSYPSPQIVTLVPLHNYLFNMLCFYGAGLIFFIPLFYIVIRRYGEVALFLVPYFIHIAFHNSGPFWDDQFLGVILAITIAPLTASKRKRGSLSNRSTGHLPFLASNGQGETRIS
jgi:hypothetical protein